MTHCIDVMYAKRDRAARLGPAITNHCYRPPNTNGTAQHITSAFGNDSNPAVLLKITRPG
jgi:hypothetical protein